MLKAVQFIAGLVLLTALEILRVYFIMPFPGSQHDETIGMAYFLHQNIFWFRIIGWLIILFPLLYFFWTGTRRARALAGLGVILYVFVFYLFNFRFLADKMFYQPKDKVLVSAASAGSTTEADLVLGVFMNNEAKAYPIEIIGYHHQVRDTVGGQPVMITYCTVCRTGRVYSPIVNGKPEQFRLVGMDHFNAMFEDATTGSWWRQVNGEAIAGPMKGSHLKEIPSQQMTWSSWRSMYPDSKIMLPDSSFLDKYEGLKDFDEGTIQSSLERRDSASWKEKSWIVGVQTGLRARAYDWNGLVRQRVINDTVGGIALLVALENDRASFHVWNRDSLIFELDPVRQTLTDKQTRSSWSWQGKATEGPLTGRQLPVVQAYQEFWHSWRTFRPHSTKFGAH